MPSLTHPNGNYLSSAQKQPTSVTERQVDVPVHDHQAIDDVVMPVMQELGVHAKGSWVPQGLRLTFEDKLQAMKFRLRFKDSAVG